MGGGGEGGGKKGGGGVGWRTEETSREDVWALLNKVDTESQEQEDSSPQTAQIPLSLATEIGPERIDYEKFDNSARWSCLCKINGELEPGLVEDVVDEPLDQQIVHAGMLELQERLCKDLPGVSMLAPAICTAYAAFAPTGDSPPQDRTSPLITWGVVWAREHFTVFQAERKRFGLSWNVEYWDPLPVHSTDCKEAAQKLLRNLELVGGTYELPTPKPGPQNDGWSCGLRVLVKLEAWIRQWRGEQPWPEVTVEKVQTRLNEFLGKLRAATKPGAQSSGPAAGSSGSATDGSLPFVGRSGIDPGVDDDDDDAKEDATDARDDAKEASRHSQEDSPPQGERPAKRPSPARQEDSSPHAKRPRPDNTPVSLVCILWKWMTVSFC